MSSQQLFLVDNRGVDFGLLVRNSFARLDHPRGTAPGATSNRSRGVDCSRRALAQPGRRSFPPLHASQNDVRTAQKVLTTLSCDDSTDEGVDELSEEIEVLKEIVNGLSRCGDDVRKKVEYLKSSHSCAGFLRANSVAFDGLQKKLDPDQVLAILSLVAMGQEHVFGKMKADDEYLLMISEMSSNLIRLEKFYNSLGGLVGYQVKSLELIRAGILKGNDDENGGGAERNGVEWICDDEETEYLLPVFLDLSEEQSQQVKWAVAEGIRAVPGMGEIYAVGGAGDRLGLECPVSGEPLPAAMLPYCGKSMMDSLLRDLQAREYLNFQITGVQSTTPVAIMTSDAKGNDWRIRGLLESRGWYGRGQDSFRLFKQPSVPVVRIPDGRWLMTEPLDLVVKPGGHGIIWKLMYDEGVFDWMINNGRKGAIVRQISNPMAGTDTTLFGLSGMGYSQDRSMGFASCERVVGASEGMNVLLHKTTRKAPVPTIPSNDGDLDPSNHTTHEYGITNIEYTEFERLGIADVAVSNESTTSCFPANTNILYVGLSAARQAVKAGTREGGGAALPGLIFNMKKKVKYFDAVERVVREERGGRMECMMQNLADSLMDQANELLGVDAHGDLSTFMVSNCRRKVTSSAKKKRKPGVGNIRQTPEGSFWDLMGNAKALLMQCGVNVPEVGSIDDYMSRGPGFIFLFNPCLGPLWDVIAQKINGGHMSKGSELVLEIAEARLRDVHIDGSLLVHATAVTGHVEQSAVCAEATALDRSSNGLDASPGQTSTTEFSLETRLMSDRCTTSDRLVFGEGCGRVRLEGVTVKNKGVDWQNSDNVYWQHKVVRNESLTVSLDGHSEFDARDVTIEGGAMFEVPDGYRMTVRPDESGNPISQLFPLMKNTWNWEYTLSDDDHVRLKLNE